MANSDQTPRVRKSEAATVVEVIPKMLVENALFPIPPGWGAMSKKTRKKLQKIWHNQLRSKAQAQALARGEASGKAANL